MTARRRATSRQRRCVRSVRWRSECGRVGRDLEPDPNRSGRPDSGSSPAESSAAEIDRLRIERRTSPIFPPRARQPYSRAIARPWSRSSPRALRRRAGPDPPFERQRRVGVDEPQSWIGWAVTEERRERSSAPAGAGRPARRAGGVPIERSRPSGPAISSAMNVPTLRPSMRRTRASHNQPNVEGVVRRRSDGDDGLLGGEQVVDPG